MPTIHTYNNGFDKTATVFGCNGKRFIVVKWWNEKPCKCNPKYCNHFDRTEFFNGVLITEIKCKTKIGNKIKVNEKIFNYN